jgi:hypothetical protein
LGFAAVIDNGENAVIEDCYFINNHFAVWGKESYDGLVIRRNFIQQKGFWERYWYEGVKGTLQWGFAIEFSDDNSANGQIYDNTISGYYGGMKIAGAYHEINDNLISKMISAGIYPMSLPADAPSDAYTAKVYRNIIHHVDYSGVRLFCVIMKEVRSIFTGI